MQLTPGLSILAFFAAPVLAQAPDAGRAPAGTSVSGIVHDSLARRPLADATVQLVAPEGAPSFVRAAQSDSLGRYLFSDVPDGRYMLGFFHPMLDSLGLAPPVREIEVVRQHPVREDLAIPSAARFRLAVCGPTSREDSGAVVVGTVRNSLDDSPLDGATVNGEWIELSIGSIGMTRKIAKLSATTGDNGWFALCNVPRDGLMELIAVKGADSTARIDVHVPDNGFLRRDMYVGADGTSGEGAILTGNVRITGTVVAAADGRPLRDALVGIVGGPQARTGDQGQWTIANAPSGTRMLEVRAVGYYPERRPVNVVTGTASLQVALSTLKAVLDTVRVTANRVVVDQNRHGFMERRRSSGTGRFLTAEDISRRNPIFVSDVFRSVPGVYMDTAIRVRGAFGECSPALYIDGRPFPPVSILTRDDIDNWVDVRRVAAIEVYTDQVPPQFQSTMNGCGSIVIWLR